MSVGGKIYRPAGIFAPLELLCAADVTCGFSGRIREVSIPIQSLSSITSAGSDHVGARGRGVDNPRRQGRSPFLMQYRAAAVRMKSRPSATAGVARATSPSTFLPSSSNSGPAFTT